MIESVEIATNATLTIAPGTRVEFDGFYRLLVRGRLLAEGQPHEQIHFTTTTQQAAEHWDGIDFFNIPAANDSSRLKHCVITNALARPTKAGTARPQCGGAVSIIGVNKLAIASCTFQNNFADYGAAVYCGYGSSPVIAGCLFRDNYATWNGSVLFSVYAYPKLINNTLAGNVCLAESAFHLCGAVENFNGKITLINNIIWNNFTNHHEGSQLVSGKDYYTIANNIEGYSGNNTNLDQDPEFFGDGKTPYRLLASSPCIDQGVDHTLSSALASLDITGNTRLCGSRYDMGAHEYCGEISGTNPPNPPAQLSCAPNPFNPRTTIAFNLTREGPVKLAIYDVQGHLVKTLLNTRKPAGNHQLTWDGRNSMGHIQASGTYLYRLETEGGNISRSMTLIR